MFGSVGFSTRQSLLLCRTLIPHKQKMRGNRYRKHLENLRKSLEEKPGMATGIAVLISTTARRWARREMKNVASIRSRSRGR